MLERDRLRQEKIVLCQEKNSQMQEINRQKIEQMKEKT
jgi:hypothetical protein